MNSELKGDIRTVADTQSDYPKALREIADRPPVIYVKGRWPLPEGALAIGIVGSRRATPYGLEATRTLTTDLVNAGVMTVSGLAAGIDACAHRTTLEKGGWTLAILGHGFGYSYPKENLPLFAEIARHGTLVTEFPYDTRPLPPHFPQRNRIISGLSHGVAVMEAGERSGALITARFAAEQGRDVYALPGSIFSPLSRGCHRLIKEGAKALESAEDILAEYGSGNPKGPARRYKKLAEDLSPLECQLVEWLSAAPMSIDELVELSGTPVEQLAQTLLSLELKERIQALPGQRYVTYN